MGGRFLKVLPPVVSPQRRIPTGFQRSAQRCEERATLGKRPPKSSTLKGLNHRPDLAIIKFMPQSLAKILVHVVFSTKDRRPFLRDKALREELHRYLGGILTNRDCQAIIVGGVEDHVHILCALSRTRDAAAMVKEVKRGSSLWVKTKS